MALEFLKDTDASSVDALIDEALLLKGWTPEGWLHDVLSLIAHNHGVASYREEFRSMTADSNTQTFSLSPFTEEILRYGVYKLASHLEANGLAIVSTYKNLDPKESFHTVLLIGVEREEERVTGFYYHDPNTLLGEKENQLAPLSQFLESWRKMAVLLNSIK